jgi:uncharacterized membrane protein YtjA (UPF0391 family)
MCAGAPTRRAKGAMLRRCVWPRFAVVWSPTMLYYSAVFLVIALIAAVFGFGGVSASAAGGAQMLFIVFFVSAVLTFLCGWFRRR